MGRGLWFCGLVLTGIVAIIVVFSVVGPKLSTSTAMGQQDRRHYNVDYYVHHTLDATQVNWDPSQVQAIIQDIYTRNSTCTCNYQTPLFTTPPSWFWFLPNNLTNLFYTTPLDWCYHFSSVRASNSEVAEVCSRFALGFQYKITNSRYEMPSVLMSSPEFVHIWQLQYWQICQNLVDYYQDQSWYLSTFDLIDNVTALELWNMWSGMASTAMYYCNSPEPSFDDILLDYPWRTEHYHGTPAIIDFDSTYDGEGTGIYYQTPATVYQAYVARCNPMYCDTDNNVIPLPGYYRDLLIFVTFWICVGLWIALVIGILKCYHICCQRQTLSPKRSYVRL